MSVLSDKTIKKMLTEGKLVPGGNSDNAKYCSYEFAAASILRGGSHEVEKIIQSVAIRPSQLVWIRAREEISMPKNMVGLWIQTQTLAREGLLLLNISLIEPGYKGPLSAVLVNFGKKDVVITPDEKIAKILFLPLDGDALEAVGELNSQEYDTSLMKMAANGPKTFLQLQSFEQKADDILESMKKQMEKDVGNLAVRAKDQLKEALKGDIKGTLIKWGGPIFAGLLIGCAIVWLMMSTYLPRLSEYSKFDEIARRAAMTQQAETITSLSTRLQSQTEEIESLKKQLEALKTNTDSLSDVSNSVMNQ